MKIVHLSKNEISGGAARATNRIHNEIITRLESSTLLVKNKESNSENTVLLESKNQFFCFCGKKIDSILRRLLFITKFGFYSSGFLSSVDSPINHKKFIDADIVCLYWVSGGFLSIFEITKILNSGKQVVWRLSDMWPITGDLHYLSSENKTKLPFIYRVLSKLTTKYRVKRWDITNLTVVCPSKWIANEASLSPIFKNAKIVYVPTGVDTNIFVSKEVNAARLRFNLPLDKKLILFGAVNSFDDKRKGSDLLIKALLILKTKAEQNLPEIVVFGADTIPDELSSIFNCHLLGDIKTDADLASIYSASDVFVAPSREENLANTVLESLSCKTPCVAFNVGGMPDVINHMQNGVLVKPYCEDSLADGIKLVLEKKISLQKGLDEMLSPTFSQFNSINTLVDVYKRII